MQQTADIMWNRFANGIKYWMHFSDNSKTNIFQNGNFFWSNKLSNGVVLFAVGLNIEIDISYWNKWGQQRPGKKQAGEIFDVWNKNNDNEFQNKENVFKYKIWMKSNSAYSLLANIRSTNTKTGILGFKLWWFPHFPGFFPCCLVLE